LQIKKNSRDVTQRGSPNPMTMIPDKLIVQRGMALDFEEDN
jgi:hypothetical protein